MNDLAAALAKHAKKLAELLENAFKAGVPAPCGLPPIEPRELADTCAQTIAYSMFIGQLRCKCTESLPNLPPYMRTLFSFIGETNHEGHMRKILDKLAGILQTTDLGMTAMTEDAVIHFYENFLAVYNPDLRKSHGVFYTPQPAVKYIVRAVDDILRQKFNLPDGIADHTKIDDGGQTFHQVQILDPSTGTGTFLVEVVRKIHEKFIAKDHQREWSNYVATDLLPRLHGFEILMAPYAIAHINLAIILGEMGYGFDGDQHLNISWVNALEEENRTVPAMVVLGNPPYNVSSINKGDRSKKLIEKYKKNLGETKTNLDDDYIKFIALGQQWIEKNKTNGGILAYISNNSFLDGVTHRHMRRSLLETFDEIYVLNLHGNIRRKETAPDGSKDENVFNIMQGTSINIFIRSPARQGRERGNVFYADLYGKREEKFRFLETQHMRASGFKKLSPTEKYYFFVPKDLTARGEYEKGFGVEELFITYNSGIKTDRDLLFVDDDGEQLANRIKKLLTGNVDASFRKKYRIVDSSSYKILQAIQEKSFDPNFLHRVCYRPFDEKWIYYDPSIVSRPGKKVMQHMLHDNIALLTSRLMPSSSDFNRVFVTTTLADGHAVSDQTYVFPLYIYDSLGNRQTNLNVKIFGSVAEKIEKETCTLSEMDVFDYIYAVLHDPKYRTTYREFLKIDFPRVPYPKDEATFDHYVQIGSRLRKLHLLKDVPAIQTTCPIADGDGVRTIRFVDGKVFINATQFFGIVPLPVWEFNVGDYRPAQKFLKDRKGHKLTSEEILHYQKIVAVLNETEKLVHCFCRLCEI